MEITEFISALAVLGGLDRTLTLRFLFRVYDVNGTGEIERIKVERLLSLAYGEKLNVSGSRTRQQLDDIFRCTNGTMTVVQEMGKALAGGKATSMRDHHHSHSGGAAAMGHMNALPSPTMNLRDFETYRGPLDIFGGWVLSVLSVFTEPLPARLLAIDRRYSIIQSSLSSLLTAAITATITTNLFLLRLTHHSLRWLGTLRCWSQRK